MTNEWTNPAREANAATTLREAIQARWDTPGCANPSHRTGWAADHVTSSTGERYIRLRPVVGASIDRED